MEAKLSDDPLPKADDDVERRKLEREDFAARLREVTRQRDELLSQYESMAFQVDESTKEVDGALLEARANAKRAQDCEILERQESAQLSELTRQLDAERRKSGEIAANFAAYRLQMQNAAVEDPWSVLERAISQILCDGIAWLRVKIPPESPLLPWFDRLADFAKATGRLAWQWSKAFFAWATPRVVDLWKRLKDEVAQRRSKE
jgi:hypothetical protein